MKILALDCTAGPASCAVVENGQILAESFVNVKLTHSQTLIPMAETMLKSAALSINDIDGFAITAGPGSFTGVRIGIAALKGMAWPLGKPCVPLSTLRVMAEGFRLKDCTVCSVMDARAGQVYNANFRIENGNITRLCDDRALLIEELGNELLYENKEFPLIFAGDGARLCYNTLKVKLPFVRLAPIHLRYQRAALAAIVSEELFASGDTLSADEILPFYLRLPQAERELKKKNRKV